MDLNILDITPVFISGIIVGMIFFHAGIIAPSLFKTISSSEAGPFLRVIFPKLFMLVLILSATSTLILFASGGAVSKGNPIVVGERGPELFVPNSSGQINQNARGTGGGSTTVNFNINTVDASGFEDLLVRSRGTITQLINSAVNERGAKSII